MADHFDSNGIRGFYGARQTRPGDRVTIMAGAPSYMELVEPRSDYADDEKKRCASCGFLTQRWRDPTRTVFEEVTEASRFTGALYTGAGGTHTAPACAVNAYPLEWEALELQQLLKAGSETPVPGAIPDATLEATRRVIGQYRDCDDWYPWTPSLDPNQHRYQRDMIRIEEDRARREERLALLQAQIQSDSVKIARSTDNTARMNLGVVVVLGVVGLVVAGMAVAGTLYPADTKEAIRQVADWVRVWFAR